MRPALFGNSRKVPSQNTFYVGRGKATHLHTFDKEGNGFRPGVTYFARVILLTRGPVIGSRTEYRAKIDGDIRRVIKSQVLHGRAQQDQSELINDLAMTLYLCRYHRQKWRDHSGL